MDLEIEYKNRPLKKVCENASEAKKKYGPKMAELIHKRIDQLRAAESVEFMIKYRIGRCHGLTGDRKKQFALDLLQPCT